MSDKTQNTPWKIVDVLIATGFSLILIFVGVWFLLPWLRASTPMGWIFSVLIQCIVVIPVIWCVIKLKYGLSWRSLGFRRFGWWDGIMGILCGIGLFIIAQWIGWLLAELGLVNNGSSPILRWVGRWEPGIFSLLLLALGLFGPLWEEIYFRGFLYPALRERWGHGVGEMLSVTLFTLAHVEMFPAAFIIFLMGLILTEIYRWTGSISVVILAHGVHNLLTLWVLILIKGAR